MRGTVPLSPKSVGTSNPLTPVNYAYVCRCRTCSSALSLTLAKCVAHVLNCSRFECLMFECWMAFGQMPRIRSNAVHFANWWDALHIWSNAHTGQMCLTLMLFAWLCQMPDTDSTLFTTDRQYQCSIYTCPTSLWIFTYEMWTRSWSIKYRTYTTENNLSKGLTHQVKLTCTHTTDSKCN